MQMNKSISNVVIVVNNLNVGGVSSLISQLIKNSTSGKYQYQIVNLGGSEDQLLIEKIKTLKIPLHQVDYRYVPGYSVVDYFKKAFFKKRFIDENRAVISKLVELEPDILHLHTLPHELLLGQEVNKITNCKLVYTDHTCRINSSEINPISRVLIKFPFQEFYKGYHVIAVSGSVMNYLKEFNIDRVLKSVKLIENKIGDTEQRIAYGEKKNLKIVYVARIAKGKGHADLLNAWKIIPPMGLHLYLIGPEDPGMNINALVNDANSNNKVTFTGPSTRVMEFLSDADIGVFPSYKEGLPLALLEKMQLGIPCIVSDISELTSLIENNVNGLVHKCGDSIDLANKITELAKDPAKRKTLGTTAAAYIKQNYVSKVGGIDKEYEIYYDQL